MTSNNRKYFGLARQLGNEPCRPELLEGLLEEQPTPSTDKEQTSAEYFAEGHDPDDYNDGENAGELYLGRDERR